MKLLPFCASIRARSGARHVTSSVNPLHWLHLRYCDSDPR
jgi:hypothetical protein